MRETLARIRVKEEHGIRRFLYPLTALVDLPPDLDYERLNIATRDNDLNPERLQLVSDSGQAVPLVVTHVSHKDEQGIETGRRYRLDFAISQGPYEAPEYYLRPAAAPSHPFSDFLHLSHRNSVTTSTQEHFAISIASSPRDATGCHPIHAVAHDGVGHLRDSMAITRNGMALEVRGGTSHLGTPLTAIDGISGSSDNAYQWLTTVQLSACKSWATVRHHYSGAKPDDEFAFSLPFRLSGPISTCDFGIGSGLYGKLQAGVVDEIVWKTQFGKQPYAQWSLMTAGRVDYVGSAATAEEYLPQRWLHLIDRDKSLAVAITEVPDSCREMTIALSAAGDVAVNFKIGEQVPESVTFGVCYHFLNDIPAIAAATNPQSILQPPTVEVLPF